MGIRKESGAAGRLPSDPILVSETARILHKNEATVRRYADRGRLDVVRVGGLRVFDRAQVEALAAQERGQP